jgi:hypothetical protein
MGRQLGKLFGGIASLNINCKKAVPLDGERSAAREARQVNSAEMADWPTIREVTRQADLSQVYVWRLVRDGRLRGIRTHLGWLVDPESVVVYQAERAAKKAAQKAVAK